MNPPAAINPPPPPTAAARAALVLYRLFAPLAFRLYLLLHPRKYGERAREKLGEVPLRDLSRPCLLVHAVSVGEVLAARTVIDEFRKARPGWKILVSTSTATGRQVAADKYGAANVMYYPLDADGWVRDFLQAVRPQLIVLMELEIWPVFLDRAARCGIPVVVANARITAESAAQYRKAMGWPFLGAVLRRAFNTPARWLAQTEEYAARLREVGVEPGRVTVSGNVKFDQIPTALRPGDAAAYRAALGAGDAGKVVVAGSTHPGEDEFVVGAWQNLRRDFPGLKLVLAPRHPHRIPEVKALAEKAGTVALRSAMKAAAEKGADAPRADVVIVDTMGELAKFYAAADAVFVGGTLIPHGGQNMAEPCGLARPTVIGNSYFNFTETVEALLPERLITVIGSGAELEGALRDILAAPEAAAARAAAARETLMRLAGASRRAVAALEEVYAAYS